MHNSLSYSLPLLFHTMEATRYLLPNRRSRRGKYKSMEVCTTKQKKARKLPQSGSGNAINSLHQEHSATY